MLKVQLYFLNTEEENPFVAEQEHIQSCPPDLLLDVCEEEDEDVDILD